MINFESLNNYLTSEGALAGESPKRGLLQYKINEQVFAYVGEHSNPLRISLRVDEALIKHLSDKYESVMPGHNLNPRKWLTLVATGQLEDEEIMDLVDRAIAIAKSSN